MASAPQAHTAVCKKASGALRSMVGKSTSKMNGLPVVNLELGDADAGLFEVASQPQP